jgi:transposase
VSLYGDYRGADGNGAPFKITQGYSKDKRPDLKQFVLSLLCVEGNVPLVGKLETSLKAIKARAKAGEKRRFFCRADAEAAANEILAQETAYHHLKLRVVERPRYARGRPKCNSPHTPIAVEFGLQAKVIEKQHELDRRRQMAGCFVLLTNVPSEGEQDYSAEEILRIYKDQNAIERNFGFLKDDQIVNALFLKRPQPH